MKNERAYYKMLSGALILAAGVMTQGCAGRHAVVAVTGTVIGVEISQNPQTQMYQAKLGYNRGEFAVVPTNRSAKKSPGDNNGGGATDTADVLMELRYGGIFTANSTNSGIYQRLAVGKVAVSQPGAAFMFAKGNDGELAPSQAQAVANAFDSMPASSLEIQRMLRPLNEAYLEFYDSQKAAFDAAAAKVNYTTYGNFAAGMPAYPTAGQIKSVRTELEKIAEVKRFLDGMKAAEK